MNKNDVAELLNSLSYRPGWTFGAVPMAEWEAGYYRADLWLKMSCRTVNTDQNCAREGYPEEKTLDWEIPVEVSKFSDTDELLRAIFDMLMDVELHESREFFRVKSQDYAAPFHPHRPEGEALWEATS